VKRALTFSDTFFNPQRVANRRDFFLSQKANQRRASWESLKIRQFLEAFTAVMQKTVAWQTAARRQASAKFQIPPINIEHFQHPQK
jgi:hypothetical protein